MRGRGGRWLADHGLVAAAVEGDERVGRRGREHEVQALGRGDEHVGRATDEGLAIFRTRVASAHRDGDLALGGPVVLALATAATVGSTGGAAGAAPPGPAYLPGTAVTLTPAARGGNQ